MDTLAAAIANIFELYNLMLVIIAVAGGILVGALPGLTGTMAIALLVPFTYGLSPDSALIVLGGVYVGAMYGGSIASILINTPGTPAAIATTFDGYPMALQGRAEEALAASATSSGIGGLLGTVALLLFSPVLAAICLKFGSPEYFWLGILGLTIIASLSGKSLAKGLMGGLLGVLISAIGLSPSTGVSRLTFGQSYFLGGVEVIVALIGLFCIPQVLRMAERSSRQQGMVLFHPERGRTLAGIQAVLRRWGNIVRSSVIGVIVGIIPGAGGNVAGLLSYQEAVRASKGKKSFGHGNIDGVIASETANNAEVEGSLIPLLTLGIPGAPQAAVLYGALLLQGLRPGTDLFIGPGKVITYTFILSLFLANLIMFAIGISASRFYARALNLPNFLLIPVVISLSVVGSFASRNSSFDVVTMLILGLIAYGGLKVGLSPAPIALGVILGPIIERGLVESMMLSQATGSLIRLFFTRPLSLFLIALTLISAGWPLFHKFRESRRSALADQARKQFGAGSAVAEKRQAGTLSHYASNLWVGLAGFFITVVSWWQLRAVELQSSIMPRVAAGLIALISVGLLAKAWNLRYRPLAAAQQGERRDWDRKATLTAIGLAVVYIVLMPLLGFFSTTFSVFVLLAWVLAPKESRKRQLLKIVLTTVLICAVFYVVFVRLFKVPFPTGLLY